MPAELTARDWLLFVSGGLAGAVFTQFISWGVYWVRRPILELAFDENDRGCVVDTPAHLVENGKQIGVIEQRYLRLRVKNVGWTTAREVNVSVTEISFTPEMGGADVFDQEVIDLPVALYDRPIFNLPASAHRYLDVFVVEEHDKVGFRFGFAKTPVRLYLRPYGIGSYSIRLFASADNAASGEWRIGWRWNGTLRGAVPVFSRHIA